MRLLPLLLTLAGCPSADEPAPEPTPESTAFTASNEGLIGPDGRQMLLRGINARVDGLFDVSFDDGRLDLEPIPPFTGDDCGVLADLGMNLLRLPVNWSAIEPVQGEYDAAYATRIVDLVTACHAVGVYTLVDLHQDAYSKHIGEDGAPLWAIVPPPDELLQGPLHDLADRHTSLQTLRSFRSFFENAEGLQDAYAAMAAWLVGRLDGTPGLVGLEIFNEPVVFDDSKLDAFHRRVADATRAVAPDLPLAFEPDALRNFSDSDPVAFPRPFTNAIYAPHHYTDVFTDGWASGNVQALRESVAGIASEAAMHGAHPLVGEFGNDPDGPTGPLWFEESLAAYDEHRLSWALWLYEEWSQDAWGLYDFDETDDGPVRSDFRDAMADRVARPFPQAVAGRLDSVSWDADTATLTVGMVGSGTHTIAAPERVWSDNPRATCDGENAAVETSGRGRVDVVCEGAELVLFP
jgi:endoglycosylceramidase